MKLAFRDLNFWHLIEGTFVMVKTLTTQTTDEVPVSLLKKGDTTDKKDASKSPFAVLMSIVSKSQKKTNEILEEKEVPQTSATINLSPSLVANVPSLQAKSQVAQTKLSTNISTLVAVTEFKASLTSPKEKEKETSHKSKTGVDLSALLSKASDKGLNITKVEWSSTPPAKDQTQIPPAGRIRSFCCQL
jgi:hypothetical protein